jgi:perosamine synthetase
MAVLDPLHVVNRIRYCGGPSVGLRDWMTTGQSPVDLSRMWPQLRDRTVIGTYRGRTAIALACRLLGIGPGDEVLVPAYNCGTEIDALLHSGASITAYRVSRRCEIDLDDLIRRKTSRTKAVYIIHYFGWEQPLATLRRWCDTQGLLLIEDCALALFSDGPSGAIGRTGDAAIYSLPKTLGLRHGGLLSLPASRAIEIPRLAPAPSIVLREELGHSLKTALLRGADHAGLYGGLLAMRGHLRGNSRTEELPNKLPEMPADYYFQPTRDAERALHPRAHALLGTLSWQEIVQRRRRNYLRMGANLRETCGANFLYDKLPAEICPLSFPLLVVNRDACVNALQAKGIAALPWWGGYHRDMMDSSGQVDARWLKNHLLTLPIHQGLNERHITYVAGVVIKVAHSIDVSSFNSLKLPSPGDTASL